MSVLRKLSVARRDDWRVAVAWSLWCHCRQLRGEGRRGSVISNGMIDRIVDSNSSSVSALSTVQNVSLLLSNYSLGRIQAGHWDLGQITAGMRCSASCPELQPCSQKEPPLLTLRNIWVSFSADPTEKKVLSRLMALTLMVCLEKIEQKIPSLIRFDEKFWLAILQNSLVLFPP